MKLQKNVETVCSTNVLDLPDPILSLIIEYLPITDALNYRLACTIFWRSSHCIQFFSRLQVTPRSLRSEFMPIFALFIQGYGRYSRLNLHYLEFEQILPILAYIKRIQDISINIEDLPYITENCVEIKRLVLNKLYEMKSKKIYEGFFEYFTNLKDLDELVLKGGQFRTSYDTHLLTRIIKNITSVSKICIDSFQIFDIDEDQVSKFLKITKNAIHITNWTLKNTYCIGEIKITLPPSTKSLAANLDTPFDSNVNFEDTELETLKIANEHEEAIMTFPRVNTMQNLRYLSVTNVHFPDNLSLKMFPSLCTLIIKNCSRSIEFLMNQQDAAPSLLKALSIEIDNDFEIVNMEFNNSSIVKILQRFNSINEMKLINMSKINSIFLAEAKGRENLYITLENCTQFKYNSERTMVQMVNKNYNLRVKILPW